MNPNESRNDPFSIRMLEPVEFDCSAGQPVSTAPRGALGASILVLEPATLEMRVPHLVLTLGFSDKIETLSAEILALDVLNLIGALSEYEKATGGRGLRLHQKAATTGAITLTLTPVAVDGAGARLNELAGLLGTLVARAEKPQSTETPVLDAIAKLQRSPTEQCRAAFARRSWSVEARVAMPV